MAKVLIACEESQRVCIEFRKLGHEAYSCDTQDCSGGHPEWHIKDDVLNHLYDEWDLMIAHPPCTYLANSGVQHLYKDKSRWLKLYSATDFFKHLLYSGIPKICIENPIPHKYSELPKYSQIIQTWQFGHGETKATCLWLVNLPKLEPTNIVEGREQRLHRLPPSPERAKLRSKTYPGIAKAMAEQWSVLLK